MNSREAFLFDRKTNEIRVFTSIEDCKKWLEENATHNDYSLQIYKIKRR